MLSPILMQHIPPIPPSQEPCSCSRLWGRRNGDVDATARGSGLFTPSPTLFTKCAFLERQTSTMFSCCYIAWGYCTRVLRGSFEDSWDKLWRASRFVTRAAPPVELPRWLSFCAGQLLSRNVKMIKNSISHKVRFWVLFSQMQLPFESFSLLRYRTSAIRFLLHLPFDSNRQAISGRGEERKVLVAMVPHHGNPTRGREFQI